MEGSQTTTMLPQPWETPEYQAQTIAMIHSRDSFFQYIGNVNGMITVLQQQILALNGRVFELDKQNKELASQTPSESAEIVESILADNIKNVELLQADHAKTMASLQADHAKTMASLQADHARAMASLQSDHAKTVTSLHADKAKAISSLQISNAELASKVECSGKTGAIISSLQDENARLVRKCNKCLDRLRATSSAQDELCEKVKVLEFEKSELEEKFRVQSGKLGETIKLEAKLKETIKGLEGQLCAQQQGGKQVSQDTLKEKNKTLSSELSTAKQELTSLRAECKAKERDARTSAERIESLKISVKTLQDRADEAEGRSKKFQRELKVKTDALRELQEKADDVMVEVGSCMQFDMRIRLYKERTDKQISDLQKEVAELKVLRRNAVADVSRLVSEVMSGEWDGPLP